MGVDPAFGVNKFGKPKVYNESETIVFNILMILMNKPGFLPSQPEIGMDIYKYLYDLESDLDVEAIKSNLAYQCSDFLPLIQEGSMDVVTGIYKNHLCLYFRLPVIVTDKYQNLILGVSVNDTGEMIYNYTFDFIQTI